LKQEARVTLPMNVVVELERDDESAPILTFFVGEHLKAACPEVRFGISSKPSGECATSPCEMAREVIWRAEHALREDVGAVLCTYIAPRHMTFLCPGEEPYPLDATFVAVMNKTKEVVLMFLAHLVDTPPTHVTTMLRETLEEMGSIFANRLPGEEDVERAERIASAIQNSLFDSAEALATPKN
jgi:hypothetical protein